MCNPPLVPQHSNQLFKHMEGKSTKNLQNAIIAILVPLPSVLFYLTFLHNASSPSPLWIWCFHHPLLLANILFFININILFWIIGLFQSCHWMIDLYWTVVPVMLAHYYATHPFAKPNLWRSNSVILLTWVWSIRLTHSYFRRERWQWGEREDWRFNDMRKQYGKHWWWMSFFAVYVSQQFFLMGICLPMYAINTANKPWNNWDSTATFLCLTGITIAYFADDTQLHNFVTKNKILKDLGVDRIPNLETGIWRYSRHPNYFGEQLWWWGLVLFGWNVGHGWTFIGSFVNSVCFVYVTVLVERRMVEQEYRAKVYRMYQKTTSVWVPWFKFSQQEESRVKKA